MEDYEILEELEIQAFIDSENLDDYPTIIEEDDD